MTVLAPIIVAEDDIGAEHHPVLEQGRRAGAVGWRAERAAGVGGIELVQERGKELMRTLGDDSYGSGRNGVAQLGGDDDGSRCRQYQILDVVLMRRQRDLVGSGADQFIRAGDEQLRCPHLVDVNSRSGTCKQAAERRRSGNGVEASVDHMSFSNKEAAVQPHRGQ
jgi:hypothetical protein